MVVFQPLFTLLRRPTKLAVLHLYGLTCYVPVGRGLGGRWNGINTSGGNVHTNADVSPRPQRADYCKAYHHNTPPVSLGARRSLILLPRPLC